MAWELDSQLKTRVPALVFPYKIVFPVPLGADVISPLTPSVIVMLPELVPALVSKIRS